jgi:hypothetical protein
VVEGWVVGPPYYPQPAGLVVWWNRPATILLVLAVIVVLLLLTAALAVQALTRDESVPAGAADPSPQPAPTATSEESPVPPVVEPAAPAGPSASPADSTPAPPTQQPGAVSLPPVPPATVGEPHYSDRLELRADSSGRDLDSVGSAIGRDITALAYGITGVSGAWLGVYGDESDPILSDCAEIPSKDWVFTVPVAELVRGLRICYLTGDGRYGYLTVTEVELDLNGDLLELVGAFGTWKKLPGQD